jgi:hypothetical protein
MGLKSIKMLIEISCTYLLGNLEFIEFPVLSVLEEDTPLLSL